ncbi:NAD(P)H-dependent oxidoreductase [Metabacillus arenae]|uniref:Flagellar biosynthesis protein FlgA n=1 Tax=Metabacillus arenae TaxID=2771434 RepID=A0A926NIJ0_9BACI|nr:flagellar biosynthesis protein FlgA [Metabacillus arenae]MBD1381986.1 flagellar biosynthesis protein FlgA [Metabacillus arenae]
MIYHHLFDKMRKQEVVHAAIIGAGHFGTAVVTQQNYNQYLKVCIVADTNLDAAKSSFIKAEIPDELIVYTDNAADAQKAIEAGKFIYTDKAEMIMDVQIIDIVGEGTGVPEAGAYFAKLAIEKGKHVAMINKEADSVIGPILKKLAQEKGVVYTPVDGDQHGLLISMVEWAKIVGLTVISAGKARDGEFVYDEKNRSISIEADGITVHEAASVKISEEETKYFEMIPEGKSEEYIQKRSEILSTLPGAGAFDLCELTIMANSTGLTPDCAEMIEATLRITELPVAYCSKKDGGIFKDEGIIDLITCFRRSDEPGMGGGVYMVVRCDNAYSNYILTTKGQIPNYDKSTAVIYRPYHLCGAETSSSLLVAGLLGLDTGSLEYKPRFDLVKKAARDIKAGEIFGNDHDYNITAMIMPASIQDDNNPIPGHMLDGNKAKVDIKKGTIITYGMVETPVDSTLWNLRQLQDETFLKSTVAQ